MEEKVKVLELDCVPYKATGTYTIKGVDEI